MDNELNMRDLLDRYHNTDFESMSAGDALDEMAYFAERFADYLENIVY